MPDLVMLLAKADRKTRRGFFKRNRKHFKMTFQQFNDTIIKKRKELAKQEEAKNEK